MKDKRHRHKALKTEYLPLWDIMIDKCECSAFRVSKFTTGEGWASTLWQLAKKQMTA